MIIRQNVEHNECIGCFYYRRKGTGRRCFQPTVLQDCSEFAIFIDVPKTFGADSASETAVAPGLAGDFHHLRKRATELLNALGGCDFHLTQGQVVAVTNLHTLLKSLEKEYPDGNA
jgi:hypothetical protein